MQRGLQHLICVHIYGPLCVTTMSACTDHCSVDDQIGLASILLHFLQDLQEPLCHHTLSACANHCVVGEQIGLEAILLHLIKELQGLLGSATTLCARSDHCVAGAAANVLGPSSISTSHNGKSTPQTHERTLARNDLA